MAQGKGTTTVAAASTCSRYHRSTAHSETHTHDDTTYCSAIRSNSDVTIAATNGDLNVIGRQVSGQDTALAASHSLSCSPSPGYAKFCTRLRLELGDE